jgi:hypothetical protein
MSAVRFAKINPASIAADLTAHDLALLAASGFERLWADIKADEAALPDAIARRTEREEVNSIIEGESLPGWDRPRDYIETIQRRGCTDE